MDLLDLIENQIFYTLDPDFVSKSIFFRAGFFNQVHIMYTLYPQIHADQFIRFFFGISTEAKMPCTIVHRKRLRYTKTKIATVPKKQLSQRKFAKIDTKPWRIHLSKLASVNFLSCEDNVTQLLN